MARIMAPSFVVTALKVRLAPTSGTARDSGSAVTGVVFAAGLGAGAETGLFAGTSAGLAAVSVSAFAPGTTACCAGKAICNSAGLSGEAEMIASISFISSTLIRVKVPASVSKRLTPTFLILPLLIAIGSVMAPCVVCERSMTRRRGVVVL